MTIESLKTSSQGDSVLNGTASAFVSGANIGLNEAQRFRKSRKRLCQVCAILPKTVILFSLKLLQGFTGWINKSTGLAALLQTVTLVFANMAGADNLFALV